MIVSVALYPDAPGVPLARPDARTVGVAIDVLRATSTLTQALANGAAGVRPFAETAQALAFRDREPLVLACGEREGLIVPGFDLGNSPFEYTAERVRGRTLAFASTNGSRALLSLEGCERRVLGAFVNASAVLRAISGASAVRIACAGKLGRFALEDAAFAGWLCRRLEEKGATLQGGAARLAAHLAPEGADDVLALVQGCSHGRYLASLGPEFARDVEFCGTLDSIDRAFTLEQGAAS